MLVIAVVHGVADADAALAGERPEVRRALWAGKLVVEPEDHHFRARDTEPADPVAGEEEHRDAGRGDDRQPCEYQTTSATHSLSPPSMLGKSNSLYLLFATSTAYTCAVPCMFE